MPCEGSGARREQVAQTSFAPSSAREPTPSLRRIDPTWLDTVRIDTARRFAICASVSPESTCASTRRSLSAFAQDATALYWTTYGFDSNTQPFSAVYKLAK